MKYIIESAFVGGKGEHYAYYGGYCESGTAHHKWATNKKDAKIYTNENDLYYDLSLLKSDYTALKFNIIEIKRK